MDWNLHELIPENQHIEKVRAFPVSKPRLIGDIGLRAFFQLRHRALDLVRDEKIDFVLIPIPSFYTSLIGPYLFRKTGVIFGIDYIDPWVHNFPGSNKMFSRIKVWPWEQKRCPGSAVVFFVPAGGSQKLYTRMIIARLFAPTI